MQLVIIVAVFYGCYLCSIGFNWALVASGIVGLAVFFDWLKRYAETYW